MPNCRENIKRQPPSELTMTKVLFLVVSGGDEKMDLALTMAANAVTKKLYEDLKVIFFGPSEERLLKLEGPAKDNFEKLLSGGER